jgi:hypothetical protein
MVKTVNPKASETPTKPIPAPGKLQANNALPQPPNTSQYVPKNSANSFFIMLILGFNFNEVSKNSVNMCFVELKYQKMKTKFVKIIV